MNLLARLSFLSLITIIPIAFQFPLTINTVAVKGKLGEFRYIEDSGATIAKYGVEDAVR